MAFTRNRDYHVRPTPSSKIGKMKSPKSAKRTPKASTNQKDKGETPDTTEHSQQGSTGTVIEDLRELYAKHGRKIEEWAVKHGISPLHPREKLRMLNLFNLVGKRLVSEL